MKKMLAVGATAALLLGASSPAFAQATIGDESLFVDASQAQVAVAVQTGDANAAADDGSAAYAYNGLHVDQYQFNGGFGDGFGDGFFD